MIQPRKLRLELLACIAILGSGCVANPPRAPEGPTVPPEYSALPDALVCVIDRSAPLGLREVPAKVRGGSIVLLDGEVIRPLEEVHPVNVIAGYAGEEEWLRRGDPVTHAGARFSRTGGERRIALDLLRRAGEFQGFLLFSGQDDAAEPTALYVPTAPGCIFQAYVRDDLIRR